MKKELDEIVSDLSFETFFCSDIALPEESVITFKAKHSFHGNLIDECFCLQQTGEGLFLTDCGTTLANLDRVFELSEPDVIKNLATIIKAHDMYKEGNIIISKIDQEKNIVPQILRFLQGISFMHAMKIFYI